MPVVLKIGDKTITYNYTWPETDIGAPPVEPCPCISRRCGGSYGSGGSWENVTGTCDASSYSSSTLDLCKAILVLKVALVITHNALLTLDLQENGNSTVVSEELLSFTEDTSEFEPKEVEFVVDVISSLTLEAATSTEVFLFVCLFVCLLVCLLFVCLLDTCSASGQRKLP